MAVACLDFQGHVAYTSGQTEGKLDPEIAIAAGVGRAQTTYKDPQGRFVIDLPKGWKYDPTMPMFQSLLEDLKEQAVEITKTVK